MSLCGLAAAHLFAFALPAACVALSVLPKFNHFPTQFNSALPEKVDLNSNTQLPSVDFPVFTTDSTQSTWLPSSSSSLPAPSAQQLQLQQHLDLPPNQQDFILFDQPIKQHRQPNRSVSQPSANGGVNQNNQQHRSQQPHLFHPHQQQQQQASSPSLQNQRVANIIQATGHQTSSSAFTNRFSSSAQNPHSHQFYASSAPSSSAALNLQNQKRLVRPPVPLFTQSTGSIPQGKMNIQGETLFTYEPSTYSGSHNHKDLDLDDFTAFEGGASTAYSSPAIPTVFDLTGSGTNSSNVGTVSPQDLLIQEPFMSAPNSSALTALTSPSIYNESPDFCDSFDVSPNFGSTDFDGSGDPWFPLFPPSNNQQDTAPQVSPAEQSPAENSDDFDLVDRSPGQQRRKSGTSPSGRHSSVAGVNSRRRDKPLPPIIVEDPSDTVAMKRARNTLAARKSRERKAQRFEELEEKIEKLTADRDYWKALALASGGQQE
ncbi:hypothetical protein B0H66DRAFT_625306 [Apodospora peruviana]|uniref:Cross-pathway control protein 1 n=1 Tax=Apodospora peruviana TaxID=516989 RepID=A0AAE0I101_9PEZI|nr:hypothetical protein B0H66DRAFT_625306 [Apodospora peruviana]